MGPCHMFSISFYFVLLKNLNRANVYHFLAFSHHILANVEKQVNLWFNETTKHRNWYQFMRAPKIGFCLSNIWILGQSLFHDIMTWCSFYFIIYFINTFPLGYDFFFLNYEDILKIRFTFIGSISYIILI